MIAVWIFTAVVALTIIEGILICRDKWKRK